MLCFHIFLISLATTCYLQALMEKIVRWVSYAVLFVWHKFANAFSTLLSVLFKHIWSYLHRFLTTITAEHVKKCRDPKRALSWPMQKYAQTHMRNQKASFHYTVNAESVEKCCGLFTALEKNWCWQLPSVNHWVSETTKPQRKGRAIYCQIAIGCWSGWKNEYIEPCGDSEKECFLVKV